MEPWPVRFAVWMSQRSGRSFAQVLHSKMQKRGLSATASLPAEQWNLFLDGRSGWKMLGPGRYQFTDGQTLSLKQFSTADALVEKLAAMELTAVSRGLPTPLQARLIDEAIRAAMTEWKRR